MHLPKDDWFLYKDGQAVKKRIGSEPSDYLGSFNGENGTYELDLDIQSDSGCLDPGHPTLLVYTNKADYEDYANPILWAAGLSITLGASLVLLGVIARSTESHLSSIRISNSIGAEVASAPSNRGHPAIRVACRDGIRNPGDPYDGADWGFPIHVKGTVGSSAEAGRGAREA